MKQFVNVSGGKDSTAVWKAIPGYEGTYEISDEGRVRSIDRISADGRNIKGHLLKERPVGWGRCLIVELSRGGKRATRTVVGLVAEVFLSPRRDGEVILHIDGDIHNNAVYNLRWSTRGEVIRSAYRISGRHPFNFGKFGAEHPRAKAVVGRKIGGGDCVKFGSISEAARFGFSRNGVGKCCRGLQADSGGYTWMYAEGDVQ